jgi:type IV pilus assembly protein PilM
MVWTPFKTFKKNCLGIDIGTSSIKIVELLYWRKRKKLQNYGEISAEVFEDRSSKIFERGDLALSDGEISKAILAILKEARIDTKRAVFSLPDFTSFFTWFILPSMTRDEVPEAVKYEARRHIPFPLSEVTLDWQIIGSDVPKNNKKKATWKILLVSVPNEIINHYKRIAALTHLEVVGMEAEVFGLLRSLVKNYGRYNARSIEKETIAIIDIGSQSTTISVVDQGVLKRSHSFDIAGNEITMLLSKSFGINYKLAEKLKYKYGLLKKTDNMSADIIEKDFQDIEMKNKDFYQTRDISVPLVDLILTETKKIAQNFHQTEEKVVDKVILAGGSAFIPGLSDYFSENLKKTIEIADPFSDIFYTPILDKRLKEMGPSYAIAVGSALRGLE